MSTGSISRSAFILVNGCLQVEVEALLPQLRVLARTEVPGQGVAVVVEAAGHQLQRLQKGILDAS